MSFKKAVKEQAKLRLALCGLAGGGKTYSALAVATNLIPGGRVAVIDTERGSASLYADKFTFDVCELESFSPLAYVEKIKEAEEAGYDVIVIDSLSHAWVGKDGALDQKDKVTDRDPRANSFTAWRSVTPKHNALVDAMLQCKAHVIATMRKKTEYVQEKNEQGKTEVRKIGLADIQRDGLDYEFTLVGDIDHSHTLRISKTRVDGIDMGDQFERPGEAFAKKIYAWLMSGAAPIPRSAPEPPRRSEAASALEGVFEAYLASMDAATDLASLDRAATGPAKPAKGTPQHALATEKYLARKATLTNGVAA